VRIEGVAAAPSTFAAATCVAVMVAFAIFDAVTASGAMLGFG
jgi:hypothetical protein